MEIIPSDLLKDVVLVKPDVFGDNRGYFFETFSEQKYEFLAGTNLFNTTNPIPNIRVSCAVCIFKNLLLLKLN
jgi:dTDP-4-dehydrorhamnose 3,5-epimerase-like enzyme